MRLTALTRVVTVRYPAKRNGGRERSMSGSTGIKREFFERQNSLRVIMSGHGLRLSIDKKITVPLGITLNFYCLGWRIY